VPFKWKWPFRWPWSRPAVEPQAAAEPAPPAPGLEPERSAPLQRSVETPTPAAQELAAPDYDLGADLLGRLANASQPPTLGARGGLNDMAQALPEVDRFLARLPASPAPPPTAMLGPAHDTADFAASLPGLGRLATRDEAGALAFPEQLEVPPAPTSELPPLGGLPDQVPGLSGAAPVLQTPAQAAASAAAAAGVPTGELTVQRQVVTAAMPTAPATGLVTSAAEAMAPAFILAGEALSLASAAPMTLLDSAPMSQVLAPENVLTGNVLPPLAAASAVLQRETEPQDPFSSGPGELVQPSEPGTAERVTIIERQLIESQRGQGQPLPPETRQHFEQAYG
jgi:hypothetical protein